MSRSFSIPLLVLEVALLGGCGTSGRSHAAVPEPKPDCSFRSATTCWTLAGRLPAWRPEVQDSLPNKILTQPPASLAIADSSAASE
jgi:hypothetical protein